MSVAGSILVLIILPGHKMGHRISSVAESYEFKVFVSIKNSDFVKDINSGFLVSVFR